MNVSSFTVDFNGLAREIITEVGVSTPLAEELIAKDDNRIIKTKALWDTGATNCVITKKMAAEMGLKPIAVTKVCHAGGISYPCVYLINIYLPNDNAIPNVRVTECDDAAGSFGIIVGMDIISMGDFALTNAGSKTTFSFRIPSIARIDYVKEGKEILARQYKRTSPNDPCPCGSKLKFKNCCKNKL